LRARFTLRKWSGPALIEVAPGIDIERDIFQRLPLRPTVTGPREMDPRVFRNAPMRLQEQMLHLRPEDLPAMTQEPTLST
jgi:propionate CoA-transferase